MQPVVSKVQFGAFMFFGRVVDISGDGAGTVSISIQNPVRGIPGKQKGTMQVVKAFNNEQDAQLNIYVVPGPVFIQTVPEGSSEYSEYLRLTSGIILAHPNPMEQ